MFCLMEGDRKNVAKCQPMTDFRFIGVVCQVVFAPSTELASASSSMKSTLHKGKLH